MKIIKQGLSKEQIAKKLNATKRFYCNLCECVFDADKGEYEENDIHHLYITRTCECPNCQGYRTAFEMRSEQI